MVVLVPTVVQVRPLLSSVTPKGVVPVPAKLAEAVKVGGPPYVWLPEMVTLSGKELRPVASADATGVPSPVAMS